MFTILIKLKNRSVRGGKVLNLEKAINCLEKGNIQYKRIITDTKDILIKFKNAKGINISHLFDASNSTNQVLESRIIGPNKTAKIRKFSISDFNSNILVLSEDKFVGKEMVKTSERNTVYTNKLLLGGGKQFYETLEQTADIKPLCTNNAILGGKPIDGTLNISEKVDGAWVSSFSKVNFNSKIPGSSTPTALNPMRMCFI